MERCAAHAPCSCLLAIGEVVGIEQSQGFFGSFKQVMLVALEWLHAADVHITQIKRFFARVHPLRQCHACPTRGLDANRIEARRDPNIVHLRRKAKVIGIVWGKAFGSVEECVNASLAQHGHTVHSHF